VLSPRYRYHHYPTTGIWYVYDRLLARRVRIEGLGVTAAHVAREYEALWRAQRQRWIEAEDRDTDLGEEGR